MSAHETPIIRLKDVALRFGDFTVHRNISLSIYENEGIVILGPSGTGKTLLLKLILGLLRPTSGEVEVFGESIVSKSEDQLRQIRRKIGMVFQGAALFDSLSVAENIAYSLREAGETNEGAIQKIISDKLAIVGLPGIEHKFPGQLSGGQKKRVGLARALASSPSVMLFDEPTTGLDPTAVRLIDDLILKLRTEFGMTAIAVTHDIESARRISSRWILVDHGEVQADGPVAIVAKENELVRNFITGNWGL